MTLGRKIILLIAAILIIDQLVKVWVKTSFYPYEDVDVIKGFFQLYYIENRGMAFGTTLGSGVWAKYVLSIFRLIAIVVIAWYLFKHIRENKVHKGLIFCMALIFAGATGNLIDGMFYDFIFPLDPDVAWNYELDSHDQVKLDEFGKPVLRDTGFLLGSVVDMFRFTLVWPDFMPKSMAGKEIFGAIWNVADAAISIGVLLIVFKYRTFFKKPVVQEEKEPVNS